MARMYGINLGASKPPAWKSQIVVYFAAEEQPVYGSSTGTRPYPAKLDFLEAADERYCAGR